MARTVVGIGNCSGRDTDKFARFRLATEPAREVAPPLLPECVANLECRVVDTRLVNAHGLFVLEVVRAWIDPRRRGARTLHHHGHGRFVVDGGELRLRSAKA
jgi:flavin reductase (DIM6/NTAB) family NADH-FMN oxidoreductase RutF